MRATLLFLCLCLSLGIFPGLVTAQTVTWTNGGGDNIWGNAANWDGGVPTATDTVLFSDSYNGNSSLDADYSIAGIRATSAYAGSFTLGGYTLTISGDADFTSMINDPGTSGTYRFTGSDVVFAPHGAQDLASFEIAAGASVTINNDSWVRINDTFTNDGTLRLNDTQVYLAGISTFTNNGTIEPDTGWGTVAFGGGTISALGTLTAKVRFRDADQTIPAGTYSGGIELQTTSASAARTYTLSAGTFNTSSLTATVNSGNDYTLTIDAATNNPTVNISGDFITSTDASQLVNINLGTGTWTITDGSVDYSAVGTINATNATIDISNSDAETLALPSSLTNTTINKNGSGSLSIIGGINFTGTYNHNSGYSRIAGSNALGTGTLIMDGSGQILFGANSYDVNNDIIINSCDVSSGGAIQTESDSWPDMYGDLIINAECTANYHIRSAASRLDLHGALNTNGISTVYFQGGTLEAFGGGNATRLDQLDGTIRVAANNGLPTGLQYRQMHVSNNTFLDLNGFDQSLASIASVDNSAATITNLEPTMNTLTLNGTTDTIYQGEVAGNINLVKEGTYIQTLTGTNTYAGTTTINAGSLHLTGSLDNSSSTTVKNGGTLSGTGTVANAVSVENGGTLAPGDGGAGILTTGSLTLNGTSILTYELGTTSDSIIVDGDLVLDGVLNITNVAGFAPGDYTLFTYSGNLTDNGITVGGFPASYNAEIIAGSGSVVLRVGEPLANRYVWTNGAGTNIWSDNLNWDQGAVPGATDTVIFTNAFNENSELDMDYTIGGIRASSAYHGDFSLAGNTLSISGTADLTAMTTPPATSGTWGFTGLNSTFDTQKSMAIQTLEVTAGSQLTILDDDWIEIGTLVNAGSLILQASQLSFKVGSILNNSGTVDLNIWGNISMGGGSITSLGTMNAYFLYRDLSQSVVAGDYLGGLELATYGSTGDITFTLPADTIKTPFFLLQVDSTDDNRLSIDGATNNPTMIINGNFQTNREGLSNIDLSMGSGHWTINGDANFSEISTLHTGTGLLELTGSGTWASSHTFYDVIVSGPYTTSGIISSQRHLTISDTLTLGDEFIVDGATDFAGARITGTGTLTVVASNTLSSAGVIETDVLFEELSNQTIPARTFGGFVTIRTTNATAPRTVTLQSGTYNFNGGLRLAVNASADFPLRIDGQTHDPNVNIAQTFESFTLGTETIDLDMGAGKWTVNGNVRLMDLNADTTIAESGGELEINGDGVTIEIANENNLHMLSRVTVSGNATLNSGTLRVIDTLSVSGHLTNNTSVFVHDSGAVELTGTLDGSGELYLMGASIDTGGTLGCDVVYAYGTQNVKSIYPRHYNGGVHFRKADYLGDEVYTFLPGTFHFNGGLLIESDSTATDSLRIDAVFNNPDIIINSDFLSTNAGSGNIALYMGNGSWSLTDGSLDLFAVDLLDKNSALLTIQNSTGQTLRGSSTHIFPAIIKSGAGELQITHSALHVEALTLAQGSIDFNGNDLTTEGDLIITNGGELSLNNLGGRTIIIGGDASLNGQAGNLLNLNPESAWSIDVSGDLNATYASIRNSTASGNRGNADPTCNNGGSNVNWSFGSEIPVLTLPANAGVDNNTLAFDFSLPEPALAGSVQLTFSRTGGNPDLHAPHTIIFASTLETQGNHTGILNGSDLSASANVASVSSATNDFLTDGSIYTVTLEYRDTQGNPPSSASNTNFLFKTTRPAVNLSASEPDSTNSNAFSIAISFSTTVSGFTIDDMTATNASLSALTNIAPDSSWTVEITPAADGLVSIHIPDSIATDSLGNFNTASNTLTFYIDQTAPLLQSLLLHSNRRIVETRGPLRLLFSEPVRADSGTLYIRRSSDSILVDSIVANNMEFLQDTLVIRFPFDLTEGEAYFLSYASGFVSDLWGNTYTDATLSGLDVNFWVNHSPNWQDSIRNVSVMDLVEKQFDHHVVLNTDTISLKQNTLIAFSQTLGDLDDDGYAIEVISKPDSSSFSTSADTLSFSWTSFRSGLDSLVIHVQDSLGGTDTLHVYFYTHANEAPHLDIQQIWAWDTEGRQMRPGTLEPLPESNTTSVNISYATTVTMQGELQDPEGDQIFLELDSALNNLSTSRTGNHIRLEYKPKNQTDTLFILNIRDSRGNLIGHTFRLNYTGTITPITPAFSEKTSIRQVNGILYFTIGEGGTYTMQLVGVNGEMIVTHSTRLMKGIHSFDLRNYVRGKALPLIFVLKKDQKAQWKTIIRSRD